MAPEHNKYLPGYKPSHIAHHEWRTAQNSASHLIPEITRLAASNPALKLLDVGSGSGTITQDFARLIPQGQVTATDISPEILARSEQLATEAGVTNISHQTADVYALPFADETFDVTHASQVLCHLDDPSGAIREMVRVTKPGGVVSLRESDLQSQAVWPEIEGVVKFNRVLCALMDRQGGSSIGGRRLIEWALDAGVARSRMKPGWGTWTLAEEGDKKIWAGASAERARTGAMRARCAEFGLATGQELDVMAEAWDEWMGREEACLGMMHGELLIYK